MMQYAEERRDTLMNRGKLFIVSGPSGVGKSTVLKAFMKVRKDVCFSVSATTRPPRAGEVDGVHYHFLPLETFREWIERDEFLEYAEYVGNFYGTPKRFIQAAMDEGKNVILDIEIQGAMQIREKCPDSVSIFIMPPDWNELERRLSGRGTNSPEEIQKRLMRAQAEFQAAGEYDYMVVNDAVEDAVRELDAIMTAEHCRTAGRRSRFITGKSGM